MLKQAKRKMQSRRIPLREGNILFDAVSLNAHREIKTGLYIRFYLRHRRQAGWGVGVGVGGGGAKGTLCRNK